MLAVSCRCCPRPPFPFYSSRRLQSVVLHARTHVRTHRGTYLTNGHAIGLGFIDILPLFNRPHQPSRLGMCIARSLFLYFLSFHSSFSFLSFPFLTFHFFFIIYLLLLLLPSASASALSFSLSLNKHKHVFQKAVHGGS